MQVEGSSTLPDPEASVMKSLAKEEELMDEVGPEMEAESWLEWAMESGPGVWLQAWGEWERKLDVDL